MSLLYDALPEFLGSLSATLVCTAGAWLLRKTARRRRCEQQPTEAREQS
ncbi:hypothetical protein [Streptomyces sp. NPDC056527]